MRRRRRQGSTWFPVLPTELTESEEWGLTVFTYAQNLIDTDHADGSVSDPIHWPLVNDVSQDANTIAGTSLRDQVQGQTWRVDRVVGNIWCSVDSDTTTENSAIICCAGIAVFPVSDDPDSQSAPELTVEESMPLNANNSAQPWLWRRTWKLGNPTHDPGFGYDPNGAVRLFRPPALPFSNAEMPRDTGPFVDTKGVKRVVQREQRLFLVTQIMTEFGVGDGLLARVEWTYDFRVLGRMIRAKNRSVFK